MRKTTHRDVVRASAASAAVLGSALLLSQLTQAKTLEQTARDKLSTLQSLISEADGRGLDATKEKMAVNTADIFLTYADWDEANHDAVVNAFSQNYWMKRDADLLAAPCSRL